MTEPRDVLLVIEWRRVADFGNVLRHTYFAVNVDIVWSTAVEGLPPLRDALEEFRGQ